MLGKFAIENAQRHTVSKMLRVQSPLGFSPQVWTDMKGQSLNPLVDLSTSLGDSKVDLVPVIYKSYAYRPTAFCVISVS